MSSVKVSVPGDANAGSLILPVVPAFAAAAGVPADDVARLEALVEQLVRFTLEHAYPIEDPGEIEVTLAASEGFVEVAVHDWGLPLTSAGGDFGPLPAPLAQLAAHASNVRLLNLGADGKRLAAELPVRVANPRLPEQHELGAPSARPSWQKAEGADIEVRLAEAGDAEGIAQLLYESYHLSYVHPDFYRPRYLVQAFESGHLVPTIATHEGRLIGHHALMPVAGMASAEIGAAVVHPAYRGLGVFGRLYNHTLDEARRRRLSSIFGDAVTFHPFTQRAQAAHGFREAALLLGLLSPMTVRGFGDAPTGRTATLRSYLPLDAKARKVNLPARYGALLASVYANLGLEVEPPSRAPADGSTVTIDVDEQRGLGFVRVRCWDAGAPAALRTSVRQVLSRQPDVVYADVDLEAVADVDAATTELNDLGFFLSGLVLHGPDGHDHFRLQLLNSDAVDTDGIVCHSAFAKALKDRVLGDRADLV